MVEYVWITMAVLLIASIIFFVIYVVIDVIKEKNYYKYCKDKIKIGDRYKEIQVYSRNPFDNPPEARWVKIVDIKDNQVGETWVNIWLRVEVSHQRNRLKSFVIIL